jgi:hypothetical protein
MRDKHDMRKVRRIAHNYKAVLGHQGLPDALGGKMLVEFGQD